MMKLFWVQSIARPGGRSIVRRRKASGAPSSRRAVCPVRVRMLLFLLLRFLLSANTISSFTTLHTWRRLLLCRLNRRRAFVVLVNVVHVFLNHVH